MSIILEVNLILISCHHAADCQLIGLAETPYSGFILLFGDKELKDVTRNTAM